MTLRFLIGIGVAIALVATHLHAQNRDVRAQRMVLDDNNGNAIIVNTAAGPITGGTLTIPDPAGVGQFLISTPSAGTQSAFGHLLPGTDNLYDLGSGASRWRHFFLSGNLQLGSGLRITEPGGTDYTELVAQPQANNITYTLPAANGAAGQVLQIASSPAPTLSTATLEWGAGAGVQYNVVAAQATATPRSNHLFDVAYAAAAPDAAATGARIASSAGAAGNNNATALTLVATKTGTGVATALNATGNVTMSEGSLLKIGGGGTTIIGGGTPFPTTPYSEQVSNVVTDFAVPADVNIQKLTNLDFSPTANHFIVAQDVHNYTMAIPNAVAIGTGGGGIFPTAVLLNDMSTANPGGSVTQAIMSNQNFTIASTATTAYQQAIGNNVLLQIDGGTVTDLYGVNANLNIGTGGEVTNSITGYYADITSSSTIGPVSEMYGMNINLSNALAGIATRVEGINMSVSGDNAVGLRISGVNGYNPTNSYAIRSDAAAQSYFNGNVGIGQLVPNQKLEVSDGNLLLSNNGTEGELRLQEPNGGGTEYTAFKAQAQANNITYTLPSANGTDGQVLRLATGATPTTGTLEWATASSGWSLTGNAVTSPGADFLGTTDNNALEIRVNNAGAATGGNQRVMRYEPGTTSPNIIGGFNGNTITGSAGSVISGGGSNGAATINSVSTSNFGVIAGGTGNRIVGSTNVMIGAGLDDTITTSNYSVIGGGNANSIVGSSSSVIPGGNYLKIGSNSFGFNGSSTAAQTDLSSTGANFSSVAYFGNANLLVGNVDGTAREVRFYEPNSAFNYPATTNYTAYKAQAQANDITYTLPSANGTDGQVLRLATGATATAGTLEWANDGVTLPFSSTTSNASTLFDITNSGAGQASNFNITGAKTATTTTMVVDNDATNTTTDAVNKTVLSVASSGDFSGAGGGSTTATGVDVNMTGTGGDRNKGMTIAVAGNDAIGLQISSGRLVYSVASIAHPNGTAFTAPNNAAIIKVTDGGSDGSRSDLTLSTTGVIEGQIIWVYNGDVDDNVRVLSTPLRTLNSGATDRDLWQFIYIDGVWRPMR